MQIIVEQIESTEGREHQSTQSVTPLLFVPRHQENIFSSVTTGIIIFKFFTHMWDQSE